MPTQSSQEHLRIVSVQVSSVRNLSVPPRLERSAVPTTFQDLNALAIAVELIEMHYQEYCARLNLEVLFADGEMGCL